MEEKKTSKWEALKEFCSNNMDAVFLVSGLVLVGGATIAQTVSYKKYLNGRNAIFQKELMNYYEELVRLFAKKLEV